MDPRLGARGPVNLFVFGAVLLGGAIGAVIGWSLRDWAEDRRAERRNLRVFNGHIYRDEPPREPHD